jgi:hypothetical protein
MTSDAARLCCSCWDTKEMPLTNLDAALAALHAGEPRLLLGLAECEWLDVKEGVYRLDDPAKAEELVKDVAGFANAKTGGLLLVGFRTTSEHGQEFLKELRPVPRGLVDLDRHRKLIRERVIPPPRSVAVDWHDTGSDKGVLAIYVPAQPPACLPFVVPGPTRTAVVSDISVAIPIREADATPWLPQAEIQRLLAAGWTATGGPTEEDLSGLIRQTVAAARQQDSPPEPTFRVGEGDPTRARHLQEAVASLSGQVTLGEATGLVYHEGPGIVQHLDGAGGDGWVLCALPSQKPVVVAEHVWDALHEAGSGAIGGDALAAVGFPVLAGPSAGSGRLIGAEANCVTLTGGTWGPGYLIRDGGDADWRWEPEPRLSLDMIRGSRNWTARPPDPELRVRVTAMPCWARSSYAITSSALRRLAAELPASDFAAAVAALSARRGADGSGLALGSWNDGQTGRGIDRGSLASSITMLDGSEFMTAEVFLSTINAEIVTIAELRIESRSAWRALLDMAYVPGGIVLDEARMRLSLHEVQALLTAAWQLAADVLPSSIEGSDAARPAGPPVVELYLAAERGREHGTSDLRDMVDFSPFGRSDRSQIPAMSVAITGPLHLSPADCQMWARRAFAYLGQAYGFTDASANW